MPTKAAPQERNAAENSPGRDDELSREGTFTSE
jgi:hypothetical protein